MNKALLLSIKPEHAYNILNGNKTLELRKSVPKGYKGWVYCYVTKRKPILWDIEDESGIDFYGKSYLIRDKNLLMNDWIYTGKKLNGTIPFRFWFDEYSFMERFDDDFVVDGAYDYNQLFQDGVHPTKMCLTPNELEQYGKGKDLYAWHIKNLDIFPKPMQLSEFSKPRKSMKQENKYWIHKAPHPYMYAWVKEEGK